MAVIPLLILATITAGIAVAAWLYRRRIHRPRAAGDLELHPIAGAPGVWLYRGFFSNSAVIAFKSQCLVVDTQVSPHGARRLKREIARKIGLPVRTVICTHHHGDHMGGNAEFAEAEIIASEDTARLAVERDEDRTRYAETFGLEFQEWHPTVSPTRTFTDKLSLELDGETVKVLRLGAGETRDACVVSIPGRGILASGDSVSTIDYPFLGTPFLDEGLHDDGEWIGLLAKLAALKPRVLLPGHGPALAGEAQIQARLTLLASLMRDLLETVRPLVGAGLDTPAIVGKAGEQLAHYLKHPGLREHTLCQRFGIYRSINSLSPARRGKGWWQDLRPSIIKRAPDAAVASELQALPTSAPPDASVLDAAVARLLKRGRPEALTFIEAVTRRYPSSAAAWGLLSDVLFDGAQGVLPTVDGTEYLTAAGRAAKKSLALDPACILGLLNLGAFEVFGGMVLAQKMDRPLARLERAATSARLTPAQRRKALFFIGKAHQMEGRDAESDRHFRDVLPRALRPFYPLLRPMMRTIP